MSDDIVDRLRADAEGWAIEIMVEAADEVERLRAKLARVKQTIEVAPDSPEAKRHDPYEWQYCVDWILEQCSAVPPDPQNYLR